MKQEMENFPHFHLLWGKKEEQKEEKESIENKDEDSKTYLWKVKKAN